MESNWADGDFIEEVSMFGVNQEFDFGYVEMSSRQLTVTTLGLREEAWP